MNLDISSKKQSVQLFFIYVTSLSLIEKHAKEINVNLLVIFDLAINYILTIKENIHGNIKIFQI